MRLHIVPTSAFVASLLSLIACSAGKPKEHSNNREVVRTANAEPRTGSICSDRFQPAVGRLGMVATEEAEATRIGLEVLEKGGNAVDAAVAVGFALAVTLPKAGNLGGGGFMIVYMDETDETVAIDYREKAPAKASRDMYLDDGGAVRSELSRSGLLSVAVPGTVAGLALARERYGTMVLTELIEPAIDLAENGFEVTEDLFASLEENKERLCACRSTAEIFFDKDGSALAPGETLVQSDLARSLRLISKGGPDAFYTGEIAEMISSEMERGKGLITLKDFISYQPEIRKPVRGTYRGYEIVSMPPPSSGGVHLIQILNILENAPLDALEHGSARTVHLVAEAMRLAFADRSLYLGDPDFVEVPVAGLTSKKYAKHLFESIDPERAAPAGAVRPGDPMPFESPDTTHYSIIDEHGNAVSNTYTINFSYGSGIVAQGTGILLNNEMDDFSAKPNAPNAFGLVGGEANSIAAGKRPLSSMSPTIVLREKKPVLVTGSPGGSRIITSTLQLIVNVVDHGMSIVEATCSPRFHHQWKPDELRIEKELDLGVARLLEEKGHNVVTGEAIGATQSILVLEDGTFEGTSDPRRPGGLALGY